MLPLWDEPLRDSAPIAALRPAIQSRGEGGSDTAECAAASPRWLCTFEFGDRGFRCPDSAEEGERRAEGERERTSEQLGGERSEDSNSGDAEYLRTVV